MKLVDNWKKGLRMFSIQAQLIAGAVLASWGALPMSWTEHIPVNYVAIPVLVLGTIGRLIKQDSVE